MNVMRLLHEAVFMNAGSYVIRPKSSSDALIWRRSMALIVPFWIGNWYCLPVRLSVMVRLSSLMIRVSHKRMSTTKTLRTRKRGDTETRSNSPCPRVSPSPRLLYLLVLSRGFDFVVCQFASVLRLAFIQPEILQRLAQASAGIQTVENRITRDVGMSGTQILCQPRC